MHAVGKRIDFRTVEHFFCACGVEFVTDIHSFRRAAHLYERILYDDSEIRYFNIVGIVVCIYVAQFCRKMSAGKIDATRGNAYTATRIFYSDVETFASVYYTVFDKYIRIVISRIDFFDNGSRRYMTDFKMQTVIGGYFIDRVIAAARAIARVLAVYIHSYFDLVVLAVARIVAFRFYGRTAEQ